MQIVDGSSQPPERGYGQNKLKAIGVMVTIVAVAIIAVMLVFAIYIAVTYYKAFF